MTPIETLIEKMEAMPAAKYEPVVIGIIDLARSLLPQEREEIEDAWDTGYGQAISDSIDFERGKTPPPDDASDYFNKTFGK